MTSTAASQIHKARRRPWHLGDAFHYLVLVGLASASAAFPFYVHFHQDEFSPPEMTFYGAPSAPEELQASSPVYQRTVVAYVRPRLELDRMATGTIGRTIRPASLKGERVLPRQPFPSSVPVANRSFQIVFAGTDRVLAVEGGRIITLRPGSKLADGSELISIVKSAGGWNVNLSNGRTMFWLSP